MNKKKFITILSSFIILIATYNLIVFLVRKNNEISFWLSYGLIMFAMVMLLLTFVLTNIGGNHKKVVGLSTKTLSFFYLLVEFIMGTIFMFFPNMNSIAVIIPHIIITALFLLLYVPCATQYMNFDENKKEKN